MMIRKWPVLLILSAGSLPAQMGSPGGGETQAIALHPTNPAILYVGAAKGLCKTTKGGQDNWPSTGLENRSPRVIVLDPGNPDILYTGTYRSGIYKSTNAAGSWAAMNDGLTDRRVRALVIHPRDGQTLYAGTDGGGVFQTSDGGKTWQERNRGLIDKTIRALLIDPQNPDTLYAGTWHGVYKSTDGAKTWSADPSGLYDVDVVALAMEPEDSRTLYAATHPRGVFRSTDGGGTWKPGEKALTEHIQCLAVDPANPGHVYAGTRAGIFRSTDRGDTFHRAGLSWSNAAWTLVFDTKTSPPTLYYGGEGGVLKTKDGGKWWDVTGPQRP